MTTQAAWLLRDDDWCDEYNDGYAWDTTGDFVACVLDHLGASVPLWRTLGDRTDVCPVNVAEVIAEQCEEHQTGLLLLATDNAGVISLATYAVAGDHFTTEAKSLAEALDVPLISREGCS